MNFDQWWESQRDNIYQTSDTHSAAQKAWAYAVLSGARPEAVAPDANMEKIVNAVAQAVYKDAERYRWIRNRTRVNWAEPFICFLGTQGFTRWTGEQADQIIDSEMNK